MTRTYLTKFLYLFHLNSSALYKLMYNDHLKNNNTYKWLDIVKSIFDECGLCYIWRAKSVYGSKELLCIILYLFIYMFFLFCFCSPTNTTRCFDIYTLFVHCPCHMYCAECIEL